MPLIFSEDEPVHIGSARLVMKWIRL